MGPKYYVGIRRKVKPEEISATLAEALPAVFGFLKEKGIPPVSAPITLYHAHDGQSKTMDLQAGFFIANAIEDSGEITCGELPAGDVAVALHRGPYEQLGQAHEAVAKWVSEQNRESSCPCWESYINDPGEVKDPALFETEIYYPLK